MNFSSTLSPLWWPTAQPTDSKLYSFTTMPDLFPIADLIVGVSVSIAPSGPGEIVASSLTTFAFADYDTPWTWPISVPYVPSWASETVPYNVGLRLTGGVAGRRYTIQAIVTTLAGNSFSYLIGLTIAPTLVGTLGEWPVSPPPSPGFGPPLILGTFGAPSLGTLQAAATCTP